MLYMLYMLVVVHVGGTCCISVENFQCTKRHKGVITLRAPLIEKTWLFDGCLVFLWWLVVLITVNCNQLLTTITHYHYSPPTSQSARNFTVWKHDVKIKLARGGLRHCEPRLRWANRTAFPFCVPLITCSREVLMSWSRDFVKSRCHEVEMSWCRESFSRLVV